MLKKETYEYSTKANFFTEKVKCINTFCNVIFVKLLKFLCMTTLKKDLFQDK